ncbi:MAG: DNA gyrase inhibitor YacG [Bdellovibrionota bacterium]
MQKIKRKCPGCENKIDQESKFFPFCSERCRLLDLGQWADEKYKFSKPLTEALDELSLEDLADLTKLNQD